MNNNKFFIKKQGMQKLLDNFFKAIFESLTSGMKIFSDRYLEKKIS